MNNVFCKNCHRIPSQCNCVTTKTLTDEEIISLINKHIDYVPDGDGMKIVGVMDFAKAIIRKAQEK